MKRRSGGPALDFARHWGWSPPTARNLLRDDADLPAAPTPADRADLHRGIYRLLRVHTGNTTDWNSSPRCRPGILAPDPRRAAAEVCHPHASLPPLTAALSRSVR